MLERITLKNVKYHQGHDGQGLNADIYIDGKKVAHVYDEARGGCFDYDVEGKIIEEGGKYVSSPERDINKELFKEFEKYVASLPEKTSDLGDSSFSYKPDMDGVIDEILTELESKKFEKKLKKTMEKKIVFGKRGSGSYSTIGFKRPLAAVMLSPKGKEAIEKLVKRIKDEELEEGEEILNDNLEGLGITV